MSSHYTGSNINTLARIPVSDDAGFPYNYDETPLIGAPSASSLSSAFTQFFNGTGMFATGQPNADFAFNKKIVSLNSNNNFSDSTSAPPYEVSLALLPSTGITQGSQSECTISFVAEQWQTFFYVYQPYITDDVFNISTEDVANGNSYSVGSSGVTESTNQVILSNVSYYTQLFKENFFSWMKYRHSNYASQDPSALSFVTYLDNHTNLKLRQQSVIFWQFTKIVDLLDYLQPKLVKAGDRSVVWNYAAKRAVELMAEKQIPSIEPSNEDVRVPDPDSIAAQNDAMMDIEQYRSNKSISQQNAQTEDAIISFSGDAINQQRTTLSSFWSSLNTILNAVIT